MVFESYYMILTDLLKPILVYPLFLTEIAIVAAISLLFTIISKKLVNQEQLKAIKLEQKSLMEKQKELQKTNPDEAMKLTSEILKLTNKQMSMNLKTTIVTLVIVIVLLPWLSFIATASTSNFVVSQENVYLASFNDSIFHKDSATVHFKIDNQTKEGEKDCFLFSCTQRYNYTFYIDRNNTGTFSNQSLSVGDTVSIINSWVIGGVKDDKAFLGLVAVKLPFYLPGFGYKFGWLMWYIILSFPFSFLFRKILGVEQ